MSYTDAVITLVFVLGVVMSLFLLHFPFFALVGVFAKKTFPVQEKRLNYGVIISARNEELVIGELIHSLQACDYPADKLTIFVIAHNCTDRTADISRAAGAVVYEYNNPAENRVGYAYRRLFQFIEEDYGTQSFDGFLVMDADNTVRPDYLSRMNDAFIAGDASSVITSFRNAKNFPQNYLSTIYGIFFAAACRMESRGRTAFRCSTRVSGTGYLMPASLVKDGWNYVTLTEDWELTADVIRAGGKILYCDDAEFFDEQPTDLPIMFRQRLRWARGHMEVFFSSFRKVAHSFLYSRNADRISKYDIGVQILPLGVMGVSLMVAQFFLLLLAPLFGEDAGEALLRWLSAFGSGFALAYILVFFSGALLLVLERKRIQDLRPGPAIAALLLYPFFLALNIPLDVAALFTKNLQWKPIPHSFQKGTAADLVGAVKQ